MEHTFNFQRDQRGLTLWNSSKWMNEWNRWIMSRVNTAFHDIHTHKIYRFSLRPKLIAHRLNWLENMFSNCNVYFFHLFQQECTHDYYNLFIRARIFHHDKAYSVFRMNIFLCETREITKWSLQHFRYSFDKCFPFVNSNQPSNISNRLRKQWFVDCCISCETNCYSIRIFVFSFQIFEIRIPDAMNL